MRLLRLRYLGFFAGVTLLIWFAAAGFMLLCGPLSGRSLLDERHRRQRREGRRQSNGRSVDGVQGLEPNGSFDRQWLRRMTTWVVTEQAALDHVSSYDSVFAKHLSNDMTPDFDYVDQFAADAKRRGRSLDFFIAPEHVVELLLYREAGLWPLYEKFKLDLLKAVDTARQRYGVDIRVFDFGNLNEATLQPLRKVGDHSIRNSYFSDVVHFRKAVGDYVLATMLGCRIADAPPADFGLEITDSNIADHLAAERAKLDTYGRDHATFVQKVHAIIRENAAVRSHKDHDRAPHG